MSCVSTETLYQESGGEYTIISNEETQMEVRSPFSHFVPVSLTLMKLRVDGTPPPNVAVSHPDSGGARICCSAGIKLIS